MRMQQLAGGGFPLASPSISPSLPPLRFQIRSAGCSPRMSRAASKGWLSSGHRYLRWSCAEAGPHEHRHRAASRRCAEPFGRLFPGMDGMSPFSWLSLSPPPSPSPSLPSSQGAGCGSQPGSWEHISPCRIAEPHATWQSPRRAVSPYQSVAHTHLSAFLPGGRGRGAKPPTAQLWGPEIDPERKKSSLKPRRPASTYVANARSYQP